MSNCPNCQGNPAIVNAKPHCRNKQCTWNVCTCGHTYDRNTGTSFPTLRQV